MNKKLMGIFFLMVFATSLLQAHAPKKNELNFDRQALSLKVKTTHPVGNVKNHHVKSIAVEVNGQQIAYQAFAEQQNQEFQEWEFKFGPEVSLPKGAELTVISTCNIIGRKKTDITLE